MSLSAKDIQDLKHAIEILENPGFAARLTNIIGIPFEKIIYVLPDRWSAALQRIARKAIENALEVAVSSIDMNMNVPRQWSTTTNRFLSGMSGAVGGFFGTPALLVELPLSTVIILRSIADIARNEGEDLANPYTKMACMEVFALSGRTHADDDTEIGYYAIRVALANTIADAAEHLVENGLQKKGSPILIQLITRLAARYGTPASQKFMAQAIPAVGAIGGASINLLFIRHFQDMAWGHFVVRRLERTYGEEVIRLEYERLRVEYEWSVLKQA